MAEQYMQDLPVNRKYTTEQIVAALHEMNGMIYLAARRLGCAPTTIYRRAEHVKIVQQAIQDSRGELVDIAEQKLRAAVLDREPWAVALVVKTLGKDRGYVERQEVQIEIRREAERIARQYDLTVEEVLAEAQSIVRSAVGS